MKDIEQILIKRCKKGDIKAFEILISDYLNKTYNIAYGMVENEEEAKDIAQDTFIKAFENIKDFKEKSKFSTWLYRITINTGKDFLRTNKALLSIEDISATGDIVDEKPSPQDLVESAEENEIILRALGKLKDDYRNIILLKDVNGFTYQEISEILDISIGTVKSRLARGRIKLRDTLHNLINA